MDKNSATHYADIIEATTKLDVHLFDDKAKLFYSKTGLVIPHFQNLPTGHHLLRSLKDYSITNCLHYRTAAQLEYLALRLGTDDSLFGACLVGPFLSQPISSSQIDQILVANQLTISDRHQLTQLYNELPILSKKDITQTSALLTNLFAKPFIPPKLVNTRTSQASMQTPISQRVNPIKQSLIERRYQMEADMMQAVSTGNLAKIDRFMTPLTEIVTSFSTRIPNAPLRSVKNISFVSNTLCRIAARNGGVNPVFIDSISEKFAVLIEKQNTVGALEHLTAAMLLEYTQLVHDTATTNFSPIIKRAIDFIMINLGHPVSLEVVATKLEANPAYLSRRFKQEVGMPMTDYINHQRIEEAKNALLTQPASIIDIALMTGFEDANYFTKVFKRFTGMTPSNFRKSHVAP